MRSDMAKVIVERPRYGSRMPTKGKGYGRRGARIAWEDQPKREGIKVRSGGSKMLNEHLSPLRRYLAKQVGRPWDKVFARICRHVNRSNPVQDHVRDHLDDYVAICVIVYYGQLCHGDGYRVGVPIYTLFYVCPRTGILRKNPKARVRFRYRVSESRVRQWPVSKRESIVRHNRAWLWVEFEEIPKQTWDAINRQWQPAALHTRFDAVLQRHLNRDEANRLYGRPFYAKTSRPASKREVRSVVNSYPRTNVAG
jgi:hypothetical protein